MASARALRIVYAGTPDFAVPALSVLVEHGYSVCAVYTQPDRPAGRGRRLRASPVKEFALSHSLPVCQPAGLRNAAAIAELAAWQADLMVVAAYGLLLPQSVLDLPRLGCINIHASLLPRWRGAAPIQRALLAGDSETGISLMQMEAGLDTGPVWMMARCPIEAAMTGGELHDRLAQLGAQTLLKALPLLALGQLQAQVQDDTQAVYAAKLSKAEAEIDWSRSAIELERQVLAFNPWPVAQTHVAGQSLRIWRAQADPHRVAAAAAGTVIAEIRTGITVATGDGVLHLTEIQPAGKRPMAAADFMNARSLLGLRLGSV